MMVNEMDDIKTLRATETWQRAGEYSVRIQGMNRQHHISLQEEFDEHDGDKSKYIVLIDDTYPVATCRFYELDEIRFWSDESLSYPNIEESISAAERSQKLKSGLQNSAIQK